MCSREVKQGYALHIYKELTDETNLEEIAQSFSETNDRIIITFSQGSGTNSIMLS